MQAVLIKNKTKQKMLKPTVKEAYYMIDFSCLVATSSGCSNY